MPHCSLSGSFSDGPVHWQRVTGNANNFENVYTLQDLDEPSAQRIRDLEAVRGAAEHHDTSETHHAITLASALFNESMQESGKI